MRARGRETRQAILRAAELVFAERGYVGARMDDVAAEVGIRRASMVYYFRDKRTLYLALLDDLFGGLLQAYRTVLARAGSERDHILGCVDVWATQVTARPGMMRILVWESARVQRATAPNPLTAEIAPILTTLSESITAGQRAGTFRPIDPVRFLMVIAGATAFLTLGMGVLAGNATPILEEDLRREIRELVIRILFRD